MMIIHRWNRDIILLGTGWQEYGHTCISDTLFWSWRVRGFMYPESTSYNLLVNFSGTYHESTVRLMTANPDQSHLATYLLNWSMATLIVWEVLWEIHNAQHCVMPNGFKASISVSTWTVVEITGVDTARIIIRAMYNIMYSGKTLASVLI